MRQIIANGSSQYAWRCSICDKWAQKPVIWLKHETVNEYLAQWHYSLDKIIVVADFSNDTHCVVCGRPGIEYNHWAPRAYKDRFGEDWSSYPGDYLCIYHHHLWHTIMTPESTTFRVPDKEKVNG